MRALSVTMVLFALVANPAVAGSGPDPQGLVPVVVTFDAAPSKEQIAHVEAVAADVVHAFRLIPAAATWVDASRLPALLGAPGVRGVYPGWSTWASHEGAEAIGAPALRNATGLTGANITVAVIDTGIDPGHPDFQGRIVERVRASWVPGRGLVMLPGDETATGDHGTHVAGILGGSGAASQGLHVGVAPGVRFVDVDVGGEPNNDMAAGPVHVMLANQLHALEWLAENHERLDVRIVQASWGDSFGNNLDIGPEEHCEDHPFSQGVLAADSASLAWIFSAGNGGPAPGTIMAPACLPRVLAVGAADNAGMPLDLSARGPTRDGEMKPDVTAPGFDVVSTVPMNQGGPYGTKSGTSMAAPYVAGLAALLLESEPELSGEAVQQRIREAATHWPQWHEDDGYGFVHAGRLLEVAPASGEEETTAGRAAPGAAVSLILVAFALTARRA